MKSLQLSSPHAIIMVGIPGAGKSYFAEHFCATFNTPVVSHSKIQSTVFGDRSGSRAEEKYVKAIGSLMLIEILKTNQSVIYDGSTGTKSERQKIIAAIESKGYKTVLLWVQTDSSSAKARSTKRSADGTYLSSDEFDAIVSSFMAPTKAEKPVVISGKHTYASQLKIVLKNITDARSIVPPQDPSRNKILDRHIAVR